MPKKPFSNKQKKKQLQEKRLKKKDRSFQHPDKAKEKDDGEDNDDLERTEADLTVERSGKNGKKAQPGRYALQFNDENQQDTEERKRKAREPLQYVSQDGLEIAFAITDEGDPEIDIPKRPTWTYSMTKEQVESREVQMFKSYVYSLKEKYDVHQLSYFEHNIETWRQLWRVLEVSNIILIIADSRHPIIHFPIALLKYIQELNKPVILVLNKIDIVPPELIVAWKHYFTQTFPTLKVVAFTSFPKDPAMVEPKPGKVLQKRHRKKGGYIAVGQRDLLNACRSLFPEKDLSDWEQHISNQESQKSTSSDNNYGDSSDEDEIGTQQRFVDAEDINDDRVLTLGLIGHPNVGKSTFLNGLYGKKVVSTSKTPGHTKYFQTIFLTNRVRLCDCPGLVFPALIEKQLQILSGMYPISQVREPYTSVGYLAARIPLVYLLKLTHPKVEDGSEEDDTNLTWSAWDICVAWAIKRRYLTAKAGRPDVYRAANSILRLAVDGRLCLCVYPPAYINSQEEWKKDPETISIAKLQKRFTGVKIGTETWTDDQSDQRESTETDEDDEDEEEMSGPSSWNKFAALAIDEE